MYNFKPISKCIFMKAITVKWLQCGNQNSLIQGLFIYLFFTFSLENLPSALKALFLFLNCNVTMLE